MQGRHILQTIDCRLQTTHMLTQPTLQTFNLQPSQNTKTLSVNPHLQPPRTLSYLFIPLLRAPSPLPHNLPSAEHGPALPPATTHPPLLARTCVGDAGVDLRGKLDTVDPSMRGWAYCGPHSVWR